MNERIEICEACIDLNVTLTNQEEVLKHLVGLLEKQNFVDSAYTGKILEREADYPTGLRFSKIAIAIPHGDPGYVKKSAIAIGKCVNKPEFGSMEDTAQKIPVDMVVLLAVKNPESHLAILNNLMEMFTFEENCKMLLDSTSKKEVFELFEKSLYGKGN